MASRMKPGWKRTRTRCWEQKTLLPKSKGRMDCRRNSRISILSSWTPIEIKLRRLPPHPLIVDKNHLSQEECGWPFNLIWLHAAPYRRGVNPTVWGGRSGGCSVRQGEGMMRSNDFYLYTTDRHEARFQGVMEWKARRNRNTWSSTWKSGHDRDEKYNYNKDLLIVFPDRENLCMFECRRELRTLMYI